MSNKDMHQIVNILQGKAASYRVWLYFPFLLLSLLIFTNLNGIFQSLTGRGELGSPLILISAMMILYLTPVKKRYLQGFYKYFSLLIFSTLILGWISGLWFMEDGNFTLVDGKLGSRQLLTSFVVVSAYYFLFRSAMEHGDLESFMIILFYIFFIVLLAGVFEQYLGLRKVLYLNYTNTRNLGFFGNPNETGMQANLTFVFLVWMFFQKKLKPLVFMVLMAFCSYGALLSYSRTAIILNVVLMSLFLGYLVFGDFTIKGYRFTRRYGFLFLSTVLLIFATVRFIAIPYYNNLDTNQQKRIDAIGKLIFNRQFNNKTTALRAGIFKDATALIINRPFTGYGLQTFSKGGLFPTSPEHGVHNMYLKIIGESGIIPVLLYLGMIIYFLTRMFRHRSKVGFVITLFGIALAVYSFSSHGVFSQKFIIALCGVFGALGYCNERYAG